MINPSIRLFEWDPLPHPPPEGEGISSGGLVQDQGELDGDCGLRRREGHLWGRDAEIGHGGRRRSRQVELAPVEPPLERRRCVLGYAVDGELPWHRQRDPLPFPGPGRPAPRTT